MNTLLRKELRYFHYLKTAIDALEDWELEKWDEDYFVLSDGNPHGFITPTEIIIGISDNSITFGFYTSDDTDKPILNTIPYSRHQLISRLLDETAEYGEPDWLLLEELKLYS